MREAARLCSYPADFIFATNDKGCGCSTDVTQAVLPVVGEYLARRFTIALDDVALEPSLGINVIDHRPLAKPFRPSVYKA